MPFRRTNSHTLQILQGKYYNHAQLNLVDFKLIE